MRKDIVVYVDMDNVLVDFRSGLDATDAKTLKAFEGNEDEIPGVFGKMKPSARARLPKDVLCGTWYDQFHN